MEIMIHRAIQMTKSNQEITIHQNPDDGENQETMIHQAIQMAENNLEIMIQANPTMETIRGIMTQASKMMEEIN